MKEAVLFVTLRLSKIDKRDKRHIITPPPLSTRLLMISPCRIDELHTHCWRCCFHQVQSWNNSQRQCLLRRSALNQAFSLLRPRLHGRVLVGQRPSCYDNIIPKSYNRKKRMKIKWVWGLFLFHNFNDAVNDNFLAIKRSLDKCCTIYANPLYRLQPHSLLHEATNEDYFIHAKEEQEEEALEVYEQFECCHKKMVKTFQTSAKRQCTFQLDSKNSFFTVFSHLSCICMYYKCQVVIFCPFSTPSFSSWSLKINL